MTTLQSPHKPATQVMEVFASGHKSDIHKSKKRVTLYIAEEQQILTGAYQSFFKDHPKIEVVGASGQTDGQGLARVAAQLHPSVILVGVKVLQPSTVESIAALREGHPEVGIVLLFAWFNGQGIEALRNFSRGASAGSAFLIKHSIDTDSQLSQVIQSVAEGRIILDPVVMNGLIKSPDSRGKALQGFSKRELDVLGLMAKGLRNEWIARELCIELKTVERYINSIYSKLEDCPSTRHTRVHAVTMFLKATGKLTAEELAAT